MNIPIPYPNGPASIYERHSTSEENPTSEGNQVNGYDERVQR